MSPRKTNAVLPDSERVKLQALRDLDDQRALHIRVVALRDAGWPLRAIGEGINVSRMSIQVWETAARKDPEVVKAAKALEESVPALPLNSRGSGATVRKMKVDVPPRDREKLAELAAQAKLVRRWTPDDAPERIAAKKFDTLVTKYVEQRGVAPMTVARYAGLTRRAIVARIERIHERQDITA